MSSEEAFIPKKDRPPTNGVCSIKAKALRPLPAGKVCDLTFEELLCVLEDVEFSISGRDLGVDIRIFKTPKPGR